ncbi:MAG: transposase [Clostridia bacterium]|nr:transposase [Clostridia bacterium]
MAKKGQKFKRYSKELKEEILKKYYEEIIPSTMLGKEYDVPEDTIRTWVRKIKSGQDVLVDHRQFSAGRAKKERRRNYQYAH